ncbi:hypothetical protein RI509_08860 [Levilactobacillus namurensis]|uniref:hypothetical protein n=2 Tax=Levilactobacillus namurensis TaxID=380393 RepID=UPI0028B2D1A7|nr:hypothetical protein [Levilactobacillus namurensis]MDT7019286.1 hypothetical protein [Levilactobacillus namurensis]
MLLRGMIRISDKVLTAILSAISAIAVGYVPVWVARINADRPPTKNDEIRQLKEENARLKEENKKLKERGE